jgi:peptidoglycan hydrolase-like protein with peptidoglycan-binding domain
MKSLAALTVLGLLASTASYAQNATGTNQQSPSPQAGQTATAGQQALSKPFVRQIQMRLKQQGVYDGKPTGNWDDQTAQAVQEFQSANNIQPTGQIDGYTIIALMKPVQSNSDMGEGSSTPPGAMGGASATPGGTFMNHPVLGPMLFYERGYQQGFAQGLKFAQEQAEQQ